MTIALPLTVIVSTTIEAGLEALPIRELPLCSTEKPPLRESRTGHWVACHLRG